MKILSLLLLAAGILAGPAYWIYAKFYTGEQAMLLPLAKVDTQDQSWSWRSHTFQLSKDMAPLGLIFSAHGEFAPNMDESQPPKDRYAATLFKDGVAAKPLTFTLGVNHVSLSNPTFREHLLLFQVVQDAVYQLEVTPITAPDIQLDHVQLEIRRNVLEPNNHIVTAGIMLLILGILGLVLI